MIFFLQNSAKYLHVLQRSTKLVLSDLDWIFILYPVSYLNYVIDVDWSLFFCAVVAAGQFLCRTQSPLEALLISL